MIILGIDASLTGTGTAVFDGEDIVTSRITVKKLRGIYRVHHVVNAVEKLLEEHDPDLVVLEGYAMGIKGKMNNTFNIGELGGALKLFCYRQGYKLLLVPPTTLKMFVTGRGNAQKDDVAASLKARYGREFDSDDEADAYGLCKFGEAYLGQRVRRAYPKKVQASIVACELVKGKLQT